MAQKPDVLEQDRRPHQERDTICIFASDECFKFLYFSQPFLSYHQRQMTCDVVVSTKSSMFSSTLQTAHTNLIPWYLIHILQATRLAIIEKWLQRREVTFSDDFLAVVDHVVLAKAPDDLLRFEPSSYWSSGQQQFHKGIDTHPDHRFFIFLEKIKLSNII